MSADIISLRRFRKAKERAGAEARAAENRAKHGRPNAEKQGTKARETLIQRKLEAHRRDKGDDTGGDEPAA
jgi:hypothetical protein